MKSEDYLFIALATIVMLIIAINLGANLLGGFAVAAGVGIVIYSYRVYRNERGKRG